MSLALPADGNLPIGHASMQARSAHDAEAALVSAARSGNRAAFATLYDRHVRMVHGMLLTRVPHHDAADLAQEVFLHAMNRIETLRDPSSFGPWLATITRRLAAQLHRQRAASAKGEDARAAPPSSDTDAGSARSEAIRILTVIRSLPETYQDTLTLRLVEGLTGPQIAACTGLSHGSVRVNLHRGMAMLKQRLGLADAVEQTS